MRVKIDKLEIDTGDSKTNAGALIITAAVSIVIIVGIRNDTITLWISEFVR